MGVNHSPQGAVTVAAINNLALITGNIGRTGAAPFSITGQCNAMGTREAGFTSSLPGYRKFDNKQDREELAHIWNISVDRIPAARGLAYPDIIEVAVQGKVKLSGLSSPIPQSPSPTTSSSSTLFALSSFSLCRTAFTLPPPATSPTSSFRLLFGEKEGTYTNSARRVSKVNPAVPPPGEARSDFDIFLALAEKLGVREEFYPTGRLPMTPIGSGSASPWDACAITPDFPGSRSTTPMACSGAGNHSTATAYFPPGRPRQASFRPLRALC
jgi:predicted molibdopterin-dependent oxidoreductase YjgC